MPIAASPAKAETAVRDAVATTAEITIFFMVQTSSIERAESSDSKIAAHYSTVFQSRPAQKAYDKSLSLSERVRKKEIGCNKQAVIVPYKLALEIYRSCGHLTAMKT
ncbi:MAG: hypothetical protein ABFR19_09575 [Pseudomonadota bacterium]